MTNDDLIQIGFKPMPHQTIMNSVQYDLGRGKYLNAGCVGTPNETIFICEKSKVGEHYTDLICIHNFDYHGYITIERVQALLDWFNAGKK